MDYYSYPNPIVSGFAAFGAVHYVICISALDFLVYNVEPAVSWAHSQKLVMGFASNSAAPCSVVDMTKLDKDTVAHHRGKLSLHDLQAC